MGGHALIPYVAGVLDGEGCIRYKSTPTVEITNKHQGMLVALQKRWGGAVRVKGEGIYVWCLYGQRALNFLSQMSKYSIVKYPQIVALFAASYTACPETRSKHIAELKRLKSVYTD